MNAVTSPSESNYLERARALGGLVVRHATATEQERRLSPELVSALIDGDFYRMLQPRSLGGGELDLNQFMEVIEEFAKFDASTAWCLAQCGTCAMASAYLDRDTALEVFGPADGIVAWGPPAPSEARMVEGGYRVSGKWKFASGGHQATWLGAQSFVFDPDGAPVLKPDGSRLIRTMLVPRKDVLMADAWHVMGLKGTGSDGYEVDDLFVPERLSFGRDDAADRREDGNLYRFSTSNIYAFAFAALALGIARQLLDDGKAVAKAKVPYGSKRPMRENNVVQAQIGRSEAAWRAAREFLYATARQLWEQMPENGSLTLEHRVQLRMSSVWAIQQAGDIADTIFHMIGSSSIFEAEPFERRFRDIHTVTQQLQGRQSHFEGIGQVLLGLEPDAALFTT